LGHSFLNSSKAAISRKATKKGRRGLRRKDFGGIGYKKEETFKKGKGLT